MRLYCIKNNYLIAIQFNNLYYHCYNTKPKIDRIYQIMSNNHIKTHYKNFVSGYGNRIYINNVIICQIRNMIQ